MTAPSPEVTTATCACGNSYAQQVVRVPESADVLRHPHRCPSCQARMEQSVKRSQGEREEVVKTAATLQRATLLATPALYRTATIDSFQMHGPPEQRAQQGRVLQHARRYLAEWPDVAMLTLFRGAPGTGKGHVAWALAQAVALKLEQRVRVVKLAALIRDLRATWQEHSARNEDDVLREYRGLDLLVIDEVSRHAFYGRQVHQHLYDVLDDRLEQQRPTILTSNEDDAGLAEILRPALMDRLGGSGGSLNFGTTSWRTGGRD